MSIADLGCGSGIFTIELAKSLHGSGKILAFDIQESSLSFLRERANYNNVGHLIETKVIDLENKNFSSGMASSFDMVTVVNMLFQIKDKKKFISEAKKLLKPNGFLVVID
ncbi:MAG: class I SAM-dependent methyltransferase [Candidatus Methanofastidiosum sp.]|nr:class I SAM-dependent methyltransferase [Methanofastidiosum sp.]